MKARTALLILLGLGLFGASSASAQQTNPNPCPFNPAVPCMTIKIFNDDPDHSIYPVITVGQKGPPLAGDEWMQAWFQIKNKDLATHTFLTTVNYRIYVEPEGVGIEPGKNVTLIIPLYTQIVQTPTFPDTFLPNQYLEWWQGGRLELFANDKGKGPPDVLKGFRTIRGQVEFRAFGGVNGGGPTDGLPKCQGCLQPLSYYLVNANFGSWEPFQLFEFTLGAKVDNTRKTLPDDVRLTLNTENVDFDLSYVDDAHFAAAMGPFGNDQVGYVGTDKKIADVQKAINDFLKLPENLCADGVSSCWPQLGTPRAGKPTNPPKISAPLNIFQRLGGSAQEPPPDVYPLLTRDEWQKRQLWKPINLLRQNWNTYAKPSDRCPRSNQFCAALQDVRQLIVDNYNHYLKLFPPCTGSPITATEDDYLRHAYAWTPFIEATRAGEGCLNQENLLQNTPGYFEPCENVPNKINCKFEKYQRVKLAFDNLNYDLFPDVFNPWVKFIHGIAPNVYAYSVDDAVGNVQADGTGFIVDVGSLANLENKNPASPPINISLGFDPISALPQFKAYRICQNVPEKEKPINPSHAAFIISPNNPQSCPVFLIDNKTTPQFYTFKLTKEPPYQKEDNKWTPNSAAVIDCTGNTGPGFQPSSPFWCCTIDNEVNKTGRGVWAKTTFDPTSAHKSQVYTVTTDPAERLTSAPPAPNRACNMGQ